MADEVIKTRFEGDSKDLVAEVEKARASVKKLSVQDLPLVKAELTNAYTASQRTANGMRTMNQSIKSSGQGLMQLAYFADDAQYGLKGIMNNIPGLVMGMGMTAGVAGAVSIAALALSVLGIPLAKATGLIDQAGNAASKMNKSFREAVKGIEAKQLAATAAAAAAKQFSEVLAEQERLISSFTRVSSAAAEKEIANAVRQTAAANELLAARAKLAGAKASTPEEKQRIADAAESQTGANDVSAMEKELAARKAEQIRLAKEGSKIYAQNDVTNAADSNRKNLLQEAEKLQIRLNGVERQAAAARAQAQAAEKEGAKKIAESMGKIASNHEAYRDQLKEQLDLKKQQAAEQASIVQRAKTEWDNADKANTQVRDQNNQRIKILEEEIAKKKEINQLAEETAKAEAASAVAAKEKAAADKASAAAKKAAKDAELAAEKAKAQGASKADFATELQALRLQAAGRQKEADALREKARLAKEAAALAQSTGISEQKALALVREKASLEKSVNDQKERGNRGEQSNGRIKLFKRGESATTFARPGNGLAKSVIEKNVLIAENRRAQANAANKPDNGVSLLEDIATTNNRLLKFWETTVGTV